MYRRADKTATLTSFQRSVQGTISSYLVFMNSSCRNFADESGMFQDATGIPSEKQLD